MDPTPGRWGPFWTPITPEAGALLQADQHLDRLGLSARQLENATHLVWGTGGSMVPEADFAASLAAGREGIAHAPF